MKRIVKDPDVRRLEIILTAEKLFEKKGYTKTSVEAIIKKANIAKGTFYYYFKTKADILQALVARSGDEMIDHYQTIIDADYSALEKLRKMFRGQEKKIKSKSAVMKTIHKPENRELQEKLNIHAIKTIAPLIAKVLQQGFDEGIFNKKSTVEHVQLILSGSQFMLDSGLFDLSPKDRKALLKAAQELLEGVCGAKSGDLSFIARE